MSTSSIRAILAANLKRIRESKSHGDKLLSDRAFALSMGFDSESDVRLINRILNEEYDVKLDTLVRIAEQLELQPWQLLLEDFDPKAPQSMPMTEEERKTLEHLRRLLNK